MRQWGLATETVTAVLEQPDQITGGLFERSHAWKRLSSGWIRVTYLQESIDRVVNTVTVRRRGPEEA